MVLSRQGGRPAGEYALCTCLLVESWVLVTTKPIQPSGIIAPHRRFLNITNIKGKYLGQHTLLRDLERVIECADFPFYRQRDRLFADAKPHMFMVEPAPFASR
jgi:hypothetical protein